MEYKYEFNAGINEHQDSTLLKEQLKNTLTKLIAEGEESLTKARREVDNKLSHPRDLVNTIETFFPSNVNISQEIMTTKLLFSLRLFQREINIKQLLLCKELLEESYHYAEYFSKSILVSSNDRLHGVIRLVDDVKKIKHVLDLLLQNGIKSQETIKEIFLAISFREKLLDIAANYPSLPVENIRITTIMLKALINRFAFLVTHVKINLLLNEIKSKPNEKELFQELNNLVNTNTQWVVKLEEVIEGSITKDELYQYVDTIEVESKKQNFLLNLYSTINQFNIIVNLIKFNSINRPYKFGNFATTMIQILGEQNIQSEDFILCKKLFTSSTLIIEFILKQALDKLSLCEKLALFIPTNDCEYFFQWTIKNIMLPGSIGNLISQLSDVTTKINAIHNKNFDKDIFISNIKKSMGCRLEENGQNRLPNAALIKLILDLLCARLSTLVTYAKILLVNPYITMHFFSRDLRDLLIKYTDENDALINNELLAQMKSASTVNQISFFDNDLKSDPDNNCSKSSDSKYTHRK